MSDNIIFSLLNFSSFFRLGSAAILYTSGLATRREYLNSLVCWCLQLVWACAVYPESLVLKYVFKSF